MIVDADSANWSMLRPADWSTVLLKMRRIPQYQDSVKTSIADAQLSPSQLLPLCRYIRTHRLSEIERLTETFQKASLHLFQGVWVSHSDGDSLLVPPIIELHAQQYVIIDGLHRVFQARRLRQDLITVAVVRGDLRPLPADVLAWSDVELTNQRMPRAAKFRNLNEADFRDIRHYIDAPGT